MPPEITDFFGKASIDTDYAIATTVVATRSPGASVLEADDVSKFADDTPVFFITYKKSTDPITGDVSVTDQRSFKGLVNTGANTITNLEIAPGYVDDLGNDEGDFVECIPTSYWNTSLINGLLTALNPDGTPRASSLNPPGMVAPFAGAAAPSGWLFCNGAAVSRSTYADLFDVIADTYGAGDGSTTFNLPDLRSRTPIGVGGSTKVATFVSRASNVITVSGLSDTGDNEFQTGQAVLYSAPSGAMTGLTHNTTYYVIRTGNLTFSLATSRANAVAGTAISLSSDGTGVQTFTLTLTTRTLAETGGEEDHANTIAEMPAHTHGSGGSSWGDGSTRMRSGAVGSDNPLTTSTGSSGAHNNIQPFLALNYIIKT